MTSRSDIKSDHSASSLASTSLPVARTRFGLTTTNNSGETASLTASDTSQSVIFQQSGVWSRAIVWGIMGLMVVGILWAALARIEEAIPADGKLEPQEGAKKIQAPIGGVVKQIYVKNGDQVKAGALLLRLESTVPQSQLTSLASTKASLEAENKFYRSQMNPQAVAPANIANLQIKPEILALTKRRNALVAENQLYQSQMSGQNKARLTPAQQQRLQSNMNELNTRIAVGKLEIGQVQKQINENRARRKGLVDQLPGINSNISSISSEIASGQDGIRSSLSQIDRQISQNQARISATKKTLKINQDILTDILPAGKAGAIASSQIKRQEQEVITRTSELEQQLQEQSRLQLEKSRLTATSRSDNQRQQQRSQEQQQLIKQRQSEISQLDEEHDRLQLSASQGAEKINSNMAIDRKDLFTQVANNDKQIDEIDDQLNKSIVENEKKITEITNQTIQAQQNLKYQEIRSPVAGEVFELNAYQDGVVNNNSTEAVVQIIPSNDVIAKVYITNKDIGFVEVGQPVDVRIDTFNFSEFGDLKGTVEWIGSDALPPDQQNPYARFPAKIKLAGQNLMVKGESRQLKAGSSVKVNIKLRDRTVLSLLTDMFSKQSDGLKNLR